jgi:peptidyl-Lys metalloendopeptidase
MVIDQTKSSLAVQLSLRVKKDEPVLARLQFTNRSSRPYELLSWLTFPGGRIDSENYFSVDVGGRPAHYIGIIKKRRNPTAADYITVKPGETLTTVVSLTDAYSISRPGILTVVYSAINPALAEGVSGDRLTSNTVSVHLD